MPRYETTFILSPDLEEAELEKNIERYTGIITGRGGTIVKQERWGMRRMAYPIKKKSTGFYLHLVHESGTDVPRELERQFLLNEYCLRYLTVRAEQRTAEIEFKTHPGREGETTLAGPEAPLGAPVKLGSDVEPEAVEEDDLGDWPLGKGPSGPGR